MLPINRIKAFVAPLILAFGLHAQAEPLPSLSKVYEPYFAVGAAITPEQVMVKPSADFIASQFNVVVAENAMKPDSLNRDGPGQYAFENADKLVNFARAKGLKVRGHTLLWHEQAADWMFRGSGPEGHATKEELTARLRTYIHDVVGHFKGRVYAWDVVNEAFVPDEDVAQKNGWRKSNWYRILGPEYIELAFRFAHEADPDALLFYNDYNTEEPRKHALIVDLIKRLKAKGIPIHGIGHQSHYTIAEPRDFSLLEQHIAEIGKLGLTNHITELEISLNRNLMQAEIDEATPELLELQASRYKDFFEMCKRQKQHISAVLMWGLHDGVSWLLTWPMARFDAPLLFDEKLQPKPAFWAIQEKP